MSRRSFDACIRLAASSIMMLVACAEPGSGGFQVPVDVQGGWCAGCQHQR